MNNLKSKEDFLFTSEFVTEGHPDKLCDIISDAILDAHLVKDPFSRVACETAAKNRTVFVFGEITSAAEVNIAAVVREVLTEVGPYGTEKPEDYEVRVEVNRQSQEISSSVHPDEKTDSDALGAGDQGMMFGYATDESAELMPLSLLFARALCHRLTDLRKTGAVDWLLPDGKTQVTMEYSPKNGVLEPVRVHTVVVSTQHKPDVSLEEIRRVLETEVVRAAVPARFLDRHTKLFLNWSGSFSVGGPESDAGLTGRKIVVDGYGGWGSIGGGAFSGKDATKVDRSGAYCARHVAKSLIASKLCRRVLVQIAYCIGHARPLSVFVDTYNTGAVCDREMEELVSKNFDLRPREIINRLGLRKPVFKTAAQRGHFGWTHEEFAWEVPVRLTLTK